jgi:hypothetical protein
VEKRLHRNNAAEWVMVIVLTPFAWITKRLTRPRASTEPSGSAAGRRSKSKKPVRSKVMIEGLPPRTMN